MLKVRAFKSFCGRFQSFMHLFIFLSNYIFALFKDFSDTDETESITKSKFSLITNHLVSMFAC